MKCDACGEPMTSARENYSYTASGLPYVTLVGVEIRRCQACGEHGQGLGRPGKSPYNPVTGFSRFGNDKLLKTLAQENPVGCAKIQRSQ